MSRVLTRRDLLRGGGLAGLAGWLGLEPAPAAAEAPPETARVRILETSIMCVAPQYVAGELLPAEGITQVEYVANRKWNEALGKNEADVSLLFTPVHVAKVDAGAPVVALAGGHVGCIELVGHARFRSTLDLRGRRIAITEPGADEQIFTSMFVSHVGLDPRRDIEWVVRPFEESARLLAEGEVDALMTGPPFSLELRQRGIGQVLVNTTTDRPWSQYFCCVLAARKDFVRRYPAATRRVVRAILKSMDICAREPDRVAKILVSRGMVKSHEQGVRNVRAIPYGEWRQFDAEDSVRFYALRLHEAGLVRSSPQKIIARGTDWRFLTALRRELKG